MLGGLYLLYRQQNSKEIHTMVYYDPSIEWDRYCDNIERMERQYIEENKDDQEVEFSIWCDKLIQFIYGENINVNNLNGKEWKDMVNASVSYIEKNFKNFTMFEGDKIYSMCDEFPEVDALDDELSDRVATCVKDWMIKLEE